MRLFTGLAIPPDATAVLTALTRSLPQSPEIKWSRPEKLHVTTAFIGEWPPARLAELLEALTSVRAPALEVIVKGLGWLPSPRHPRALYAGIVSTPELQALAAATAHALRTLGAPLEDRIYRPHVTLARVKGRLKGAIPLHAEPIANFTALSFHLYVSAEGKYTKLEEFPLLPS